MDFEEGKKYILQKIIEKEDKITLTKKNIDQQEDKLLILKNLLYNKFGDSIQLEH